MFKHSLIFSTGNIKYFTSPGSVDDWSAANQVHQYKKTMKENSLFPLFYVILLFDFFNYFKKKVFGFFFIF